MKAHDPHLEPGEHHQWGLHTPIAVHRAPERPVGVSITAVVLWFAAGFLALAFLLAFVPFTPGQNLPGRSPAPGYSAFTGAAQNPQGGAGTWSMDTATQAAIAIVLAVVFAGLGIGLWRLRPWARIAVLAAPGVIVVLMLLANLVQPFLGGMIGLLVVWAALAVYLLRGDVAAAFKLSPRQGVGRQGQSGTRDETR